jgi:hypothetical protein
LNVSDAKLAWVLITSQVTVSVRNVYMRKMRINKKMLNSTPTWIKPVSRSVKSMAMNMENTATNQWVKALQMAPIRQTSLLIERR